MKKSIFSFMLALALALSCAGASFADSSATSPVFTFGENKPFFTQLVSGQPFYFKFSSRPSVMDDYEPLYNDVEYKVSTVSGNQVFVYCRRNGSGGQVYGSFDYTNTMLGFAYYSGGSCWVGISSISNPSLQNDNQVSYLSNISVTYGSTFEWSDMSAVADLYSAVVPAGYALRVYSDSAFTLSLIDYQITGSWNFSNINGSPYRYNGARFGLALDESIVENGSADTGSLVPWNPTNSNLFGRASNYSYEQEYNDYQVINTYSYIITNPLYYGSYKQSEGSDNLNKNVNMTVNVFYSHSDTVYFDLIPLKAVLTYSEGIFTYSNIYKPSDGVIHGVLVPADPENPDSTGTVDFGNPPADGGNTDEPPLSENTTIFGLLNTLIGYVSGFFNSAVDAMQSIVQQGSTFMQSVLTMFSWLPQEVTAVMYSGLIILLVVGVVKVFWK